MKGQLKAILFFTFCLTAFACTKDASVAKQQGLMHTPIGFSTMLVPDSNAYTPERWALGKRLFYETKLSKGNTVSCASCHKPQFAFGDNTALSLGDGNAIGTSNVPTLANIGYHPYYTRAGGVPTLEMQILVPIQEHNEFNSNILDIAQALAQDASYVNQSMAAYNRTPDAYVITRALANFERSLISGNSAFDQFYYQGWGTALSASAQRGYQLFNSVRTNCSSCHSGFNFTDYSFKNNGLYKVYADSGRMRLTKLESDRALFKVPTLRNIALTAPYMHDGSIKSLADVVAHYNTGGKQHSNQSTLVKPLKLSAQEQQDLIAFLQSLTDTSFVNDARLMP
jgi:cytochrome c peroxidase